MTSKEATWNSSTVHQRTFEHMKKYLSREILLIYPNFSKPVKIKTYVNKVQLGAVISQNN